MKRRRGSPCSFLPNESVEKADVWHSVKVSGPSKPVARHDSCYAFHLYAEKNVVVRDPVALRDPYDLTKFRLMESFKISEACLAEYPGLTGLQ